MLLSFGFCFNETGFLVRTQHPKYGLGTSRREKQQER